AVPAELLWRTSSALHRRAATRRRVAPPVPAVSVGNLAVGGAGKTPVAAWLAAELRGRGARPALLHGGYAADEPALHQRLNPEVPVYTGRNRLASARQAAAAGADILVLDDAFQHHALGRDLDLVLVAAEHWTAHPRLLPRGPWREGPGALRRADLVVVTRRTSSAQDAEWVAREVRRVAGGVDAACLHLRPAGWECAGSRVSAPAEPALAVTAVADPAAFAANARQAGAEVHAVLAFPDHHDYDAADAARIRGAAGPGGVIVTTGKDAVKLEKLVDPERLWVLRQEVVLEHGAALLTAALDRLLAGRRT
ncbi:MAG: tetraacyldisaccharide 4'-kinase, partial [Gemmatimonadota bacterium]